MAPTLAPSGFPGVQRAGRPPGDAAYGSAGEQVLGQDLAQRCHDGVVHGRADRSVTAHGLQHERARHRRGRDVLLVRELGQGRELLLMQPHREDGGRLFSTEFTEVLVYPRLTDLAVYGRTALM